MRTGCHGASEARHNGPKYPAGPLKVCFYERKGCSPLNRHSARAGRKKQLDDAEAGQVYVPCGQVVTERLRHDERHPNCSHHAVHELRTLRGGDLQVNVAEGCCGIAALQTFNEIMISI